MLTTWICVLALACARGFLCAGQRSVFGEQLFRRFAPGWIERNAGDRAHLLALRLVKVPNALGACLRVDLVVLEAHRNGFVGALGLADITIDAVVGDQ
jgi:hypothetical protein